MIRDLPPSPSRDRPNEFSGEMDVFLAALPGFVDDANALEQSLQLVATTGTSTTSLAVGVGSKSLTTQPGKAWATGAWVYVFAAASVSNYMVGRVTSYNVETGALVVNVSAIDGSGTHTSWVIGLATPVADGHLIARDGSRSMTGELLLAFNAVNALGAVTKQQMDAAVASAVAGRVRFADRVTLATTSGVAVDLNGLPTWAQRITVIPDKVSTSGADQVGLQLGTASAFETTLYEGSSAYIGVGVANASTIGSGGFTLPLTNSASTRSGRFVLERVDGNVWECSGYVGDTSAGNVIFVFGRKSLSGALTRLRLTTILGSDTFDGGQVSMIVEGW